MSLKNFLQQYIQSNSSQYPEIINIYSEHEKVDDECFLILEENEADFIPAGQCTAIPIEQSCDIGLVLKFNDRTEDQTISLIDDIAARFIATLRQDLTLSGLLLSGQPEKKQKTRFNDYGMKARCVHWLFSGKYWGE